MAVINFATSKQRLPGYIQPVQRAVDPASGARSYVVITSPVMNNAVFQSSTPPFTTPSQEQRARYASRISWAGMILPQVEREDLWNILVDPQASAAQSKVVPLPVYICPADTEVTSSPDNAALSYVANTGAWDWNQSGKYLTGAGQGDTADNGLFHNLTDGRVSTRLEIFDGAGTTLLLAENVHKNNQYNWLGITSSQLGEQHFGMVWVVNPQPDGTDANLDNQARFGYDAPQVLDSSAAESDMAPYYARPASSHPAGSFNVVFADGHLRSLSPNLDYLVYQQLMTPKGRKCVDPQNWDNSGAEMQAFWAAPPISESDLE